jgi:hypothetical protein
LTVTAALSAAYVQAGVGLGLLHDGQTINGSAKVTIHATNATPADVSLTGNGSGTVHAPGGTAQPLSVTVSLGSQQWTPTASGTLTLAQALTGTISHTGVTAPTNGSVELDAALLHATNDTFIVCRPGTVDAGGTFTAATNVPPFVSAAVAAGGGTTTTTTGGTTTTTAGGTTTTTAGGTTTTTASGATTTTALVAGAGSGTSGSSPLPQAVTVSSPSARSSTVTTAATRVLGESISRPSASSGLARTGSTRTTLLLAFAGVLLLDLGYLATSATRPGRRLALPRRRERG